MPRKFIEVPLLTHWVSTPSIFIRSFLHKGYQKISLEKLPAHNQTTTLSPIIMGVENYIKWKDTNIGDTTIFHWTMIYGREKTYLPALKNPSPRRPPPPPTKKIPWATLLPRTLTWLSFNVRGCCISGGWPLRRYPLCRGAAVFAKGGMRAGGIIGPYLGWCHRDMLASKKGTFFFAGKGWCMLFF